MEIKTKQWPDGSSATIQYDGQGDGQIIITSDPNEHYETRSMQITVETTDGSGIQRVVTVNQTAKQRIDLFAAVVTAANQTYSGSAKTPTPTVTLNGSTVPSSGYDVAYSNNTNAGTATITITGKGDYTGTASGTFTINKATGVAGVSGRSLTYSRNAQNLVTVSGNTGTVHYRLGTSGSWSTIIPTATNADTYTIYYYVDASNNYNAVGSSSNPYDVSTTMAKRTPVLSTSPTLVTGLTYTGSAQNLLSGGSVKHSSSDSTSVSGTFTYAQGTNAGTYSSLTWSFTPSSSNYNSISGTVSGSVTIDKANRTISFTKAPTPIDIGGNGILAASVSAGNGDGTISFSSSNTSKATISGDRITGVAAGTATITASVSAGTNYKSATATYTVTVAVLDYVDMGVSVKWAKCNIGSDSPYQYNADFFSWGNIQGHPSSGTSFSDGYNFGGSVTTVPYVDTTGASLSNDIDLANDAARQNLGSPWKMPTANEYKELFNNCNFINANGNIVSGSNKIVTVNGVSGIYLESKTNGNRLFFAACGLGSWGSIYGIGSKVHYWSSTYRSSENCHGLNGDTSGIYPDMTNQRQYGMNIRAVRD